MNRSACFPRIVTVLLAVILGAPATLRAANPVVPEGEQTKLSAILGGDAVNWKITPTPVIEGEPGRVTMSGPTGQILVLESTAPHAAPTELIVDFRLIPPTAGSVYTQVQMAYPDGRGAIQLGAGWKESGGLIAGLRPDTDFYLFVVYTANDGKPSKPSAPLKFSLKDRFGYK